MEYSSTLKIMIEKETCCCCELTATTTSSLEVELGAAPMAALFVPLDTVASTHADPAGDGAILLNLLSILHLHGKRLEAAHFSFFL